MSHLTSRQACRESHAKSQPASRAGFVCRELTSFGEGLHHTSFPLLQRLFLNYGASLTSLAPLATLSEVSMAGFPMKQRLLEGISQLQALTKLDISHYSPTNTVSDESLVFLTALTALESLNVGGALHMSDTGLQTITHMHRLTELDLSGCGVTTEGIEALSLMASLGKLKCLRCSLVNLGGLRSTAVRLCLYRGHRQQELMPPALLQ